jgi:hypothetical protein
LQNAASCTKASSNKMGAGGARAARRIRIRRPPVPGVHTACGTRSLNVRCQTSDFCQTPKASRAPRPTRRPVR